MSEDGRRLERVQRAGQRLLAADKERLAALHEATLALQANDGVDVQELTWYSGLSTATVRALLSRSPAVGRAGKGPRMFG